MVRRKHQFTGGAGPSGGWNGGARESSGNITLPDTIACALCERELPRERYSPSAQRRLISEIRRYGMNVLVNQRIARCDGCGTQSRSEIHCMTCNHVRPIDEFAHTQRQLAQPTCLPCQDLLQLDERDKVADNQEDEITELPSGLETLVLERQDNLQLVEREEVAEKQDEPVSELTRAMENLAAGRVTANTSESAPAVTRAIGMAENIVGQESALEENEDSFVPANHRFGMRAESWSGGANSASAIRTSAQNQNIIGDMSFAIVFGYDDDVMYSSSYQW